MVVCLSSGCAADGTSTVQGAQIAADEINLAGGILGKKIIFVAQDSAEAVSGAKAMSAYRQIRLDSDIHFLIGPSWTPGGLTLAPVVSKDKGIIITTPSLGVKEFHEAGDNIFNIRGTDEVSTRALAQLAIGRGWRKAAIFSSQQPWESMQARFFQEEFEKLGGKIVAKVEPLPTVPSLSAEALRIKSSNPEFIFFSSVVQLGLATKEMHRLGWEGDQLAAFVDDIRIKEADGTLDRTIFMTFSMPLDEFSKKYTERYGRKPEIPAGASYDAVYAYAKAIQEANSFDVEKVKSEMLKLHFNGASGEVRFDKDGCAVRQIKLWKVAKDSIVPVEK